MWRVITPFPVVETEAQASLRSLPEERRLGNGCRSAPDLTDPSPSPGGLFALRSGQSSPRALAEMSQTVKGPILKPLL